MDNLRLESFDGNGWCDLIDYSNLLDEVAAADLCWSSPQIQVQSSAVATDVSRGGSFSQVSECPRKRGRTEPCGGGETKACREKIRREKLNDRFVELSAILEPGKPVKTDKLAILGDTIRILGQLKTESQESSEMNEKLLEEIKTLKAEKNELREEKLVLKADKERIEQQLKSMAVPSTGFIPPHPPLYQTPANKMPMFPGYSFVPMWHYLPSSTRDTSQDSTLRPPAA
ncbi:transcription factor bHLH104-like [Primulina huaijiensis]|uniref:transcription factor bHLH104-like n=1 Tax=Primulina huaijiensis TaxID=1492673 RepID=UPI003CC70B2D